MRLVIDLQALQGTGGRQRGIGRYSMALLKAMLQDRGDHEVILVLNGAGPDTTPALRDELARFLPPEHILCWESMGGVMAADAANRDRRRAMEMVREAFIASLQPDAVLILSLFEGFGDDLVCTVRAGPLQVPTAVVLYDFIPLHFREEYLPTAAHSDWYHDKLAELKRADAMLAISEATRAEADRFLDASGDRVVNVSAACDDCFQPRKLSPAQQGELLQRYCLRAQFLLCIGAPDQRKNIDLLVEAFAGLPPALRADRCLTIVGAARDADHRRLRRLGTRLGLTKAELVLTGFVPDEDLAALYSTCELFVFPSGHEGFGLPALEAMQCGSPVIAARASSLPEVVGHDEQLFEPGDARALGRKLTEVLTDAACRTRFAEHGVTQAASFSWQRTAQRAWQALERIAAQNKKPQPATRTIARRPRLAYVSPLPPERSGISDYSAIVLPALAEYYEIDVIVNQEEVSDPWIRSHCPIRSVDWFENHYQDFDRIVYHMGNSAFHAHMFALIRQVPGVVVLHDFFLSGITAHLDLSMAQPGLWWRSLEAGHGWAAVRDAQPDSGALHEAMRRYPCNLSVLQDALGVIVHSEHARALVDEWYDLPPISGSHVVSMPRGAAAPVDRAEARRKLGFGDSNLLVCAFGMLGPTKRNDFLLNAWERSELSAKADAYLVYIGGITECDYLFQVRQRASESFSNVRFTDWVGDATYSQWLAATDFAVQLTADSRGQTSAALLDCLNYRVPTVAAEEGASAEIPNDAVFHLPPDADSSQLALILNRLARDGELRASLATRSAQLIEDHHRPAPCAQQMFDAIERIHSTRAPSQPHRVARAIADAWPDISAAERIDLAGILADNLAPRPRPRQLLLDVSELARADRGTGIQRVVRNILKQLLLSPPAGYLVRPVYCDHPNQFRYARRYAQTLLGCPVEALQDDDVVQTYAGDVFVGMDLFMRLSATHADSLRALRRRGVRVLFTVYDLLPYQLPECFPDDSHDNFVHWLNLVADCEGALCISQSVADALSQWVRTERPEREKYLHIAPFMLGADIREDREETPRAGLSSDNGSRSGGTRFLMVGTVEPRKGHAQALEAFERLWRDGFDGQLLIVGKPGWMITSLIKRIRTHPEIGQRLFWYEQADDDQLSRLYNSCDCLIAASMGEGFGLPLIEAAQHRLPIIARDIPVFREVAGPYAHYFPDGSARDLAQSIGEWQRRFSRQEHPRSDGLPWITWEESARQFLHALALAPGEPVV